MCDTGNDIHLHRIDLAVNMRRFYSLTLQPTLFGGASVIRNWGRIGTSGQAMGETFDDPDEAQCALKRLEAIKRRRGYRVPKDVSEAGVVEAPWRPEE